MNLLKRIFTKNQPQKDCPRCLGKGHVDEHDIKRLNQVLSWRAGPCAYCNSTGKIDPEMEKHVPADTAYLTTDLGPDERRRLINGDAGAWERAAAFDIQVAQFIDEVCYLHFDVRLTAGQVTAFYMLNRANSGSYENERQELLNYIHMIISKKAD